MMNHNKKFRQTLEVIVTSNRHDTCLIISKYIKHQCDAWAFCVKYDEHKSARKGDVLKRDFLIYQEAYSSDIIIFKEAIRILSFNLDLSLDNLSVEFLDRGAIPIDKY